MPSYLPLENGDCRRQYTGVLIAGSESDTIGDSYRPLGSGFFVAPYLVLTARHVIDEVAEQFHGCPIHEIADSMAFGLDFTIQHSKYGHMIWSVMGYDYTSSIDVVAMWVELRAPAELPADFEWELPALSLSQATVGQAISVLGFPHSTHRMDQGVRAIISVDPHESRGVITAIHEQSRDRIMLPYPCFEAGVTTKGGMSGGPVFTADGNVIGVVGSSLELGDSDEPDVSFITAIWPTAGIHLRHTGSSLGVVKMDIRDEAAGYPLQALVDKGVVRAGRCLTTVDAPGHVTMLIPDASRESLASPD